jgi:crossover junction endodeoxyribonuclease RuvC
MIIGIDPGLSGAIAFLDESNELIVEDVPVLPGKTRGSVVNIPVMCEIMMTHGWDAEHAFIEQVSSMPKQGVATTFKFGETYGAQRAIVEAMHIPVTYVSPSKWKPDMGLNRDKGLSRTRATQLFPSYASLFKRVKDDGRAEAALIAYYGREKLLKGKTIEQVKEEA